MVDVPPGYAWPLGGERGSVRGHGAEGHPAKCQMPFGADLPQFCPSREAGSTPRRRDEVGWVWDQLNPLLRDHGDVASRGNKLKTPGPKAPGQPHRDPGPV